VPLLVPALMGSARKPFTAADHARRFTRELASRVAPEVAARIVAMSRDLDRFDPAWLAQALSAA